MPQDSSSPVAFSPLDSRGLRSPRYQSWQVASSLLVSFRYAWIGLSYAFQTQRNFRVHLLIGSVAIALSIFLQIPSFERALIGLTIALVLTLELINTALESVVDLTVGQTYHELAKIAKDCAAAAVLIGALAALWVASLLLLPPLWSWLLGLIP
jgi:diacylglycerol kinase (ATP)